MVVTLTRYLRGMQITVEGKISKQNQAARRFLESPKIQCLKKIWGFKAWMKESKMPDMGESSSGKNAWFNSTFGINFISVCFKLITQPNPET